MGLRVDAVAVATGDRLHTSGRALADRAIEHALHDAGLAPSAVHLLVNAGIGLITPPVGPTLFVGCAIGRCTMEEVSRELWPFYVAMLAALAVVTYVPALSLWLPGLLR